MKMNPSSSSAVLLYSVLFYLYFSKFQYKTKNQISKKLVKWLIKIAYNQRKTDNQTVNHFVNFRAAHP